MLGVIARWLIACFSILLVDLGKYVTNYYILFQTSIFLITALDKCICFINSSHLSMCSHLKGLIDRNASNHINPSYSGGWWELSICRLQIQLHIGLCIILFIAHSYLRTKSCSLYIGKKLREHGRIYIYI